MEKIFKLKNFSYFVWTPFVKRVYMYKHFFLQVHFNEHVISLILLQLFATGINPLQDL